MSNFLWKEENKKLIRKKKLCQPTVPIFFGDVSGNKEQFFLRLVLVDLLDFDLINIWLA